MQKIDLVVITDQNIDNYINQYINFYDLKFNKIFIVTKDNIITKYKNVIYKDFVNEEYLNSIDNNNITNEIDNIRYLSLYYYIIFEDDILKQQPLILQETDKIKKDDEYHYSAKLFLKHFFNKTQVNKIEGFKIFEKNKIKDLKEKFPEIFHNSSMNNNKGFKHNIFILNKYL